MRLQQLGQEEGKRSDEAVAGSHRVLHMHLGALHVPALHFTLPPLQYLSLHTDVRSISAQSHDHDHALSLRQQSVHQLVLVL